LQGPSVAAKDKNWEIVGCRGQVCVEADR